MEGWAEDDVEERGEGDSSVLFHFMNRNLDQTKPKQGNKKGATPNEKGKKGTLHQKGMWDYFI